MKVFISWSGEKSKAAALALRKWLPDVIQAIDPWVSQHDIDAGARWNRELAQELEQTQFGILCVTKSNVKEPWLLFEGGALSKTLTETFVCPYLLDLDPTELPPGPLTQFMTKRANEDDTLDLIKTINKAEKERPLSEDHLTRTFQRCWPDLERVLQALPDEDPSEKRRGVEEMVEEILLLTRGLSREGRSPFQSAGITMIGSETDPTPLRTGFIVGQPSSGAQIGIPLTSGTILGSSPILGKPLNGLIITSPLTAPTVNTTRKKGGRRRRK